MKIIWNYKIIWIKKYSLENVWKCVLKSANIVLKIQEIIFGNLLYCKYRRWTAAFSWSHMAASPPSKLVRNKVEKLLSSYGTRDLDIAAICPLQLQAFFINLGRSLGAHPLISFFSALGKGSSVKKTYIVTDIFVGRGKSARKM